MVKTVKSGHKIARERFHTLISTIEEALSTLTEKEIQILLVDLLHNKAHKNDHFMDILHRAKYNLNPPSHSEDENLVFAMDAI